MKSVFSGYFLYELYSVNSISASVNIFFGNLCLHLQHLYCRFFLERDFLLDDFLALDCDAAAVRAALASGMAMSPAPKQSMQHISMYISCLNCIDVYFNRL